MKTALITTTINVPHVLKLYRACSPAMEDVRFFVAGDCNTPEAAVNFCQYDVFNTQFLFEQDQQQYACSELIGWNTISRRNIALLEALKWGAEIIVTIDDDNIPMNLDYFYYFEKVLSAPFSGLMMQAAPDSSGWFDPGWLTVPATRHRGFPESVKSEGYLGFTVDAKVGVAAGVCLGDPDIGAVQRIDHAPIVVGTHHIGREGFVVEPNTRTVFNSQNTSFTRELAPCFLMVPQFRRYDDIFASLVAQRVMRELNQVVHFGQPFVWQTRNAHDLLKDLDAETWGMKHVVRFADWLDGFEFQPDRTVLEMLEMIYGVMPMQDWLPIEVHHLGRAWIRDCARVMA